MSLREELDLYYFEKEIKSMPVAEWRDHIHFIIKIFEKRIDEMINEAMKKNGTEIRENGNNISFRMVYDDQIATLRDVKEMLKT